MANLLHADQRNRTQNQVTQDARSGYERYNQYLLERDEWPSLVSEISILHRFSELLAVLEGREGIFSSEPWGQACTPVESYSKSVWLPLGDR